MKRTHVKRRLLGAAVLVAGATLSGGARALPNKIKGDVYHSARLNLTAELPAGFDASTGDDRSPALNLDGKPGNRATGIFEFVDAPPDLALQSYYFSAVAGLVGAMGKQGKALVPVSSGTGDVGWAKGPERIWKIANTEMTVRALLLPDCGGKASLGFIEVWSNAANKSALDGWIGSFTPTDDREPPACRDLRTAAATKQP